LIPICKDKIPLFEFPNMAGCSDIMHGVFTRNGGVSKGPYKSLNVSFSNGDDGEHVTGNRRFISQYFAKNTLVFTKQVHGTDIHILSKQDSMSCKGNPDQIPFCDALVTDVPGKMLVIQVADCQPVLLYDPQKRVVANVHSGWRGSISNIIGKTIKVMEKKFGCRGGNIFAGIGPSLGPCCAEFIHFRKEIPEIFWKYRDNSDYFDFWSISIDQLCSAGVLPEKIFSSKVCTKCNTDQFFSYRGEGVTGRFAAVIGLI
jgi:YfiH family protein